MKTPSSPLGRCVGLTIVASLLIASQAWAWPYNCHRGGYEPGYFSRPYTSYGYSGNNYCSPSYRSYNLPEYGSYWGAGYGYGGYGVGSYFGPSGYSYYGNYGGGYTTYYGSYTVFGSRSTADYGLYPKVYVYTTHDFSDDPEGGQKALGWRYLAEGDLSQASAVFSAMERQYPAKGWPKIGTGLIAAMKGNYSNAGYNFRRAFRFDPDGPGEIPESPELKVKIVALAEHYRDTMSRSKKNADAAFMLAAFSYLSGDYPTAREAVEKAIARGDESRDAQNLRGLVDRVGVTRVAQE